MRKLSQRRTSPAEFGVSAHPSHDATSAWDALASAMARPIPHPAPVTNTILSCKNRRASLPVVMPGVDPVLRRDGKRAGSRPLTPPR
jgi:hypothetical protein